jgi:hypothetical protein
MTEDDDLAIYEEGGFPNVHYTQPDAALIQALGTFIAQLGKLPPDHPAVAPSVAILEGIKPPQLKAVK